MCIYLFLHFHYLKQICIIWINPKIPKIGYIKFTKLAKPIPENKTAVIHIRPETTLKVLLLSVIFFKNPIPREIAVVKIEINIIPPYIFFIPGHIWLIAYTAGICSCFISISTFIKNKNTVINKIITIPLTIIEIYFMFLGFFISSFIDIKTGISNTQL